MGLVQCEAMAMRFCNRLGASAMERTTCASAGGAGYEYTVCAKIGVDTENVQDVKLIIWGGNPIASNLHLRVRVQEAKRPGARLIAIDPYRSLTAEKCHQHIALLPGTDAALALGIMHVLIAEDLLDRDYIREHMLGFEELKGLALDWPYERAAAVCGISAEDVRQLGREYGATIAVTLIIWRATNGVIDRTMTLSDLVLVNSCMIQLSIPLRFLGVIYREIKQSLADMERLFSLLEQEQEIADAPDAASLLKPAGDVPFSRLLQLRSKPPNSVRRRLHLPVGTTTAVVGQRGSGKSTLSRLLFRCHEVNAVAITIGGQDVRNATQSSLRPAIGIVLQDTILFNDTIEYNIAYGDPGCSKDRIVSAANAAYIHDFLMSLPDGYDSMVGERGLQVSGGEKQRVAIARTLLKNPAILIFDEVTSVLDSNAEQAIQSQPKEIARHRTTLVMAHRL